MAKVVTGCLVLADITGYGEYLSVVELEHSQDVLSDLMGVLVGQLRGLLHLAKLEGDAVFCYEHGGEVDASMLLSMIESCYFAFSQRVQTIHRRTTCQCNACRLIPRLDLKFLTHHGQFAIHEVAGSRELVGRDVVLVHRLPKNSVTARTGLRGYAFFTQACLQRFPLDPVALRMVEHKESFEDVGEVSGYVHDLVARWREEQARRVVYIAPGAGIDMAELDVQAPPGIVWDYLTSPTKRPLWQGSDRVDQRNPAGIRGVGTINHCVHGTTTIDEEILDWKPFRYFTFRGAWGLGIGRQMGGLLFTVELSPTRDGSDTHIAWRMGAGRGLKQRMLVRAYGAQLRSLIHTITENLTQLLMQAQAEAAERARAAPLS